jgi:hypothetical protein
MICENNTNIKDVWGPSFLFLMGARQDGFDTPRRQRIRPASQIDDGQVNVFSCGDFKRLACN